MCEPGMQKTPPLRGFHSSNGPDMRRSESGSLVCIVLRECAGLLFIYSTDLSLFLHRFKAGVSCSYCPTQNLYLIWQFYKKLSLKNLLWISAVAACILCISWDAFYPRILIKLENITPPFKIRIRPKNWHQNIALKFTFLLFLKLWNIRCFPITYSFIFLWGAYFIDARMDTIIRFIS